MAKKKDQIYARTFGMGAGTRTLPMGSNRYQADEDDDDDDEEIDITKIIPDDPLFRGTAADSIGNNPDMAILLQDEEILKKFQDKKTADLLREIAHDSSKIENLIETTEEIKFLFDKISAQFTKTRLAKEAAAKLAAERAKDPDYVIKLVKAEKAREAEEKAKAEAEEKAKEGKN